MRPLFRKRKLSVAGQYRLQNEARKQLWGYGDGDWVHLRDEFGNSWWGRVQVLGDDTTRFVFRDEVGRHIVGIADEHGIVLRDDEGHTWRGSID